MAATVQLQYQNATATGGSSAITVQNGTIALTGNQGVMIDGTIPATSTTIISGSIAFGTSPGSRFMGGVTLQVASSGSGDPTITVSGLSGTATLSWQTNGGMNEQMITPGDAMTLTGFAG